MKKFLTAVLVFVLCLSVCACGEKSKYSSPAVEKLVNRIDSLEKEPLTMGLEPQIHTAELLLGNLTSEEQEEVHNREVLTELRTKIELLEEKLNSLNQEIADLTQNISPDDLPALQKQKEMYDSLNEADKALVNEYDTIEQILNEFDAWYGSDSPYQKIKLHNDAKNYAEAITIGKEAISKGIPTHFAQEYSTLIGLSLTQEAQKFYEAGNHQSVIDLYDEILLEGLLSEDKQPYLGILGDTYVTMAQNALDKKNYEEVLTVYKAAFSHKLPADKLAAVGALKNTVLVKQAETYYKKKAYADVISFYEENKTKISDDSSAQELKTFAFNSYVALSKKNLSQKKYAEALTYAKSAHTVFADSAKKAEALTLQEEILKKARPANGAVLERKINTGYNEFKVSSSSSDALIKLESVNDPNKYILFFVHANSSATVKVCNGKYIAKYVTGDNFIDKDTTFLVNASYSKADQTIEMNSYTSGGSIYYQTVSITLYTVIGGNLETEEINPNEF